MYLHISVSKKKKKEFLYLAVSWPYGTLLALTLHLSVKLKEGE